jgi:tRNA dimethylallyltransferase
VSGDRDSTVDAVLIAGPTCAGKTALALALAARFPVEIVSVDSAQVYRGMDIGTAKPTAAVRAHVPHHLIDLCDPAERYSAGRFRRDALEAIAAIRARGRVPLLVGGTMLYFRALTRGLAPLPEADPELRARIDARARREGWPVLHAELATRDPELAARIRPADGQRIQRALEVMELTGRRLSELQRAADPSPFAFAAFALVPPDRTALYASIDARVCAMMAEGFLAEVAALRARGDLSTDLPSLRAVGYRQLWAHLEGACSLEIAVAACQRATRNLAKRQLTWLRGEPGWQCLQGVVEQELALLAEVLARAGADGRPANVW